ncbi:WhiB family transcriptional regulator [Plantactinospora sp. BB1]|uniref:WhiB family transcriptional regulator n=1 Tax=Plantactinospora sp. BB1 TaxID=2071627 RepID=UPI000D164F99|nr:WhiB family transcriptional regulator [Plantactinospora sp. BB1]AVT37403.1 WhiB family transcriptional regulator [Plantactinospora sp. BB1]
MTVSSKRDYGNWPTFLDHATETPACRGTDLDLWFPEPGERWKARRARAICNTCPLQPECETWAHQQPTDQLHGIWGGTTHHDRRARQRTSRTDQPSPTATNHAA